MANEQRVREDYKTGTVTDNPLLFDATEMNSAELAAVREVNSDQHMTITLDPLGEENGPETAWIIEHEAGATVATLLRGREATEAVEHAQGRRWAIGPGKSDFEQVVAADEELPDEDSIPYRAQSTYDLLGGITLTGAPSREGPLHFTSADKWERDWNLAWGLIEQTNPNDEGGLHANGIVATPSDWNLNLTATCRAGRDYMLAVSGGFQGTSLDVWVPVICDGGNVVLCPLPPMILTDLQFGAVGSFIDSTYCFRVAADGSKTFKLRGYRGSGSGLGAFGGSFDRPCYMRLYDMGPWANPT